jgi:hypothetical protein
MEEVLPRVNQVVMDDLAGKQVVPYLPLEGAFKPRGPASEAPAASRPPGEPAEAPAARRR